MLSCKVNPSFEDKCINDTSNLCPKNDGSIEFKGLFMVTRKESWGLALKSMTAEVELKDEPVRTDEGEFRGCLLYTSRCV